MDVIIGRSIHFLPQNYSYLRLRGPPFNLQGGGGVLKTSSRTIYLFQPGAISYCNTALRAGNSVCPKLFISKIFHHPPPPWRLNGSPLNNFGWTFKQQWLNIKTTMTEDWNNGHWTLKLHWLNIETIVADPWNNNDWTLIKHAWLNFETTVFQH